MPDFFGKRYGSKTLKLGASAIVFIFLIPYTASLYNGLSRLFAMAFNIDYTFCIALMAGLTAVYVVAGGYMATAINDFVQGIIMLGGIVAVVLAVLNQNGGLAQAMASLSQVQDPAVSSAPGAFTSLFGPKPIELLGVVILTSLGTWGLPQMVQKFYAIKSEKQIFKGTVISTVFAVVIAGGCYFLGGFGRLYGDRIDVAASGFDSIIPTMMANFSPLLIGIVVVLVLSASMSTLSALVLASSSTLTLDFIKGTIVKKMDEKKQVLVMRVLILVFIAISVVIAIFQYRANVTFIAQLMGVSWGALAGSFLAPFLYGLYWRRANRAGVWASFIFGAGIMLLNLLARPSFPPLLQSPINCGAFAMLAGLVIVPVVSALTKPIERHLVDDAFECYRGKIDAPVRKAA